MATFARLTDFAGFPHHDRVTGNRTTPRPSLFRRIVNTIAEAQERKAYRDVERIVARRAGVYNDALEREIGERLLPGNWNSRRY